MPAARSASRSAAGRPSGSSAARPLRAASCATATTCSWPPSRNRARRRFCMAASLTRPYYSTARTHDYHGAGVEAGAPGDVLAGLPGSVALARVAVAHDAPVPRLAARRVVAEELPLAHVCCVRMGRIHEPGVDAQTDQAALGALAVDALHELLLVGVEGDAGGGCRGQAREQQGGQRHQQDHDPTTSLHGSPPSPAVVCGCPLLAHPSTRGIGRDQQKLRVSEQIPSPALATPQVEACAGLRRPEAAASANVSRLAASGAAL